MEQDDEIDIMITIVCIFIILMVLISLFKTKKNNEKENYALGHVDQMQVDDEEQNELQEDLDGSVVVLPPSSKYQGKWGTRCWRDDQCMHPFGCNGQWCDMSSTQSNR
jgi:hypothetical protein